MALINCSECGREVSDAAASCPGCGHPLAAPQAQAPQAPAKEKPTSVVRSGGKFEAAGFILIIAGVFMGIAGQGAGAAGAAIGIGFVVFLIGRFK